ncbi:unnamed protein product, partial [Pylaiella littoralis]
QAGGLINSTVQAPRPAARGFHGGAAGPRGGARRGTCRQFDRTGDCRFGSRCVFTHVHNVSRGSPKRKAAGDGGAGTSGGSHKESKGAAPAPVVKKTKDA